ncbi:MAG: response regulator [Myxococcales bacterium]|nr:response regulator [Myxococcales bacterium]
MRKVLVGESNYAEFEVLNDFLTGKDFEVHWVKNGNDALAAFSQLQPDLMILDALLPGLTGLKVCQRARKLPGGETVKVVLLSKVYRQFKEQYESRAKMGVDAYSEKPVNVGELDKILQQLLEETAPRETAEAGKTAETKRTLRTSGLLSETPFPRLLFYLHKYHRTGALRVSHEQISKVIYLREGSPIFVTSNLANESLGRFMVERGVISDEQYNSSLERMVQTGEQQGHVLLEMGILTPHQLYEAMQAQIREKILRVFAWDEGEYEFRPGSFKLSESVQLDTAPLRLTLEGIKRFYNLSRLERYFNEYKNQRLRRVKGSLVDSGEMLLTPHEAKFYKLIDGKRTVGKIVALSNLSLSETFQILYYLLLIEVIRFIGDPGFGDRSLQEQEAYVADKKKKQEEVRRLHEDRGAAVSERMHQFRNQILQLFDGLDSLTFYDLLRLPAGAGDLQVRTAYHGLVKELRPYDLYAQADDALRAKCDQIFSLLTQAYETLLDPQSRQRYDARLFGQAAATPAPAAPEPAAPAAPAPPEEADDFFGETAPEAAEAVDTPDIEWEIEEEITAPAADDESLKLDDFFGGEEDETKVAEAGQVTASMANLVKSELEFQHGEDALHRRDFEAAKRHFAEARALSPKEAEYSAYLGWATFLAAPDDAAVVAQGRDLIEKAISINPVLDSAYTFLGRIHLQTGNRDRARASFEQALQYNPDNARARQELTKLEVE